MTPAQRRLLHKLAKGLGYKRQDSRKVCPAKCRFIRDGGGFNDILHLPTYDDAGVCRFYPGRRLLNGNAFHTWTYEQAVSALTAQLLTQKETT